MGITHAIVDCSMTVTFAQLISGSYRYFCYQYEKTKKHNVVLIDFANKSLIMEFIIFTE